MGLLPLLQFVPPLLAAAVVSDTATSLLLFLALRSIHALELERKAWKRRVPLGTLRGVVVVVVVVLVRAVVTAVVALPAVEQVANMDDDDDGRLLRGWGRSGV